MPDTFTLEQTQRWLQAVISHPAGAGAGLASADARAVFDIDPDAIEAIVEPSRTLSAAERVGVYAKMYYWRLIEVLEKDFNAVVYAMGNEQFAALARAYVAAHPSRFYSLNIFGAQLPAYIRDEAPQVEQRRFLAELASLQWAMQVVFDAPRAAALTPDDVLQVRPEDWETRRLPLTPAHALLACTYPVNAFLQAVRDKQQPTIPEREERTWVLVYRKQLQVWREDVDATQFALLTALERGAPLGDALAAAAEAPGADPAVVLEHVGEWFRRWAAAGLFAADGDHR